jgi:hypothetical protein
MPVRHGPTTGRAGAPPAEAGGVSVPVAGVSGLRPVAGAAIVVDARSRRLSVVHQDGRSVDLEGDGGRTAEADIGPDSGTLTIATVPPGFRVVQVQVQTKTSWDGGTISVGDTLDPESLIPPLPPMEAGQIADVALDARYPEGASVAIVVGPGASVGASRVQVRINRI